MWYHENIGGENCAIVDTWWQTETGSIMISPLPGVTSTKPGSACGPLPGIESIVIDNDGNQVGKGEGGFLAVKSPWPSMLRTVYGEMIKDIWILIGHNMMVYILLVMELSMMKKVIYGS